jgi:Zn-dependent M16 (insulinase) family peptidase
MSVPERICSFVLKESQEYKENGYTGYLYIHEKFGTPFLYIKTEDTNNFMSIQVRTPQEDDSGISHMLEHLTLHGSKKYPINHVFFELARRSYANFLNAFTSSEYTCFPFSTTNKIDFMNCLDVYLDCVFHPLLGDIDFLTECHRTEFKDNDPNNELVRAGVVYNEMRGSYSTPSRIYQQKLKETLYPDSATRFDIGGKPSEIPKATIETLRKHHDTYYNPVNALFFFYGSFPVEEVFTKVSEVIDPMNAAEPMNSTDKYIMKPWAEPRTADIEAPADDKIPIEEQYKVSIAWALDFQIVNDGLISDLDSLVWILANKDNSPFYKALLETGLAKDFSVLFFTDKLFPSIQIDAIGVKEEQKQEVEKIILDIIKKYSEEDVDFERLESFYHSISIQNRMTSEKNGLAIFQSCALQWMHGANPLELINYNKNLEESKERTMKPGYIPGLVKKHLLENKHRLHAHLIPIEGYLEKIIEKEMNELEDIKKSLTEEQIERLVEDKKKIDELQNTPQPVELLKQIKRTDISKESLFKHCNLKENEISYLFNPTNGIAYLNILIEAPNDIPYLWCYSLFNKMSVKLGAGRFDGSELPAYIQRWLSRATIQISSNFSRKDLKFYPTIAICGVCLYEDIDKCEEVLKSLITSIHFDNYPKIEIIMNQLKTNISQRISQRAYSFNTLLSGASVDEAGKIEEEMTGITGFMKQISLIKNSTPQEVSKIVETLFKTLISNALDIRACVCCQEEKKEIVGEFAKEIVSTIKSVPKVEYEKVDYSSIETKNAKTFLNTAIQTAYVAMKKFSTPYSDLKHSAAISILMKILSNEAVHEEIREKFGAYGCWATVNSLRGILTFSTYRDTVPLKTSEALMDIAKNAEKYITEEAIERAVISYLKDIDAPENIATFGMNTNLYQVSYEDRQSRRDIYLSLTVDELKKVVKFISEGEYTFSITTSKKVCEPPEGFEVIEA